MDGEVLEMMRPAWADPRWVLAANVFAVRTVILPPGTITRICDNDPTRWSITFPVRVVAGQPIFVAPDPNPQVTGYAMNANIPPPTYTVFTHGPMVNVEWYAFCLGGTTFPIWECQVQ